MLRIGCVSVATRQLVTGSAIQRVQVDRPQLNEVASGRKVSRMYINVLISSNREIAISSASTTYMLIRLLRATEDSLHIGGKFLHYIIVQRPKPLCKRFVKEKRKKETNRQVK